MNFIITACVYISSLHLRLFFFFSPRLSCFSFFLFPPFSPLLFLLLLSSPFLSSLFSSSFYYYFPPTFSSPLILFFSSYQIGVAVFDKRCGGRVRATSPWGGRHQGRCGSVTHRSVCSVVLCCVVLRCDVVQWDVQYDVICAVQCNVSCGYMCPVEHHENLFVVSLWHFKWVAD